MARKLVVEIVGDSRSLEKAFDRSSKSAANFNRDFTRGATRANQSIGSLRVGIGSLVKGTAVIGGVTAAWRGLKSAVAGSIDEWKEQTQVAAQTGAVIKSTGGVAGISAGHVDKLAAKMSDLAGMDDEAVQAGENLLLTFTQIRNVAGKNNDIFDQAVQATTDLGVAMKMQPTKAAMQLGKALNDPARGLARLQRIGVVFNEQQKEQVKSMMATGNVMGAQRVILKEITREFGGSAEAAGKTLPGQLNRLRETFKNLGGELVGSVTPALQRGASGLNEFITRLSKAEGVEAKLDIVWEGIESVGRDLYERVRSAIAGVDWGALKNTIANRLRSIDWASAIETAGRQLGRAFIAWTNFLRDAINRVDWQQVGRYLADGFVIAVAALVKFLASVDWVAVVKALVGYWRAAIGAMQQLVLGIGKELARLLLSGVRAGIEAAGRELKKLALKIVLQIVEPFTHLPSKLGAPMRRVRKRLEDDLAELETVGAKGGERVVTAVQQAMDVKAAARRAAAQTPRLEDETPEARTAKAPTSGDGAAKTTAKKLTAAEKRARANQWFDAAIARKLDRLQDLGLRKQLESLRAVAAQVRARMAATSDATRRLTLEDQLLGILRQQKGVQTEITDQVKATNQALKDRAEAIKTAVLDRLGRRQTDVLNQRALRDARERLRIAKQLGGPLGVRAAREGLQDVGFDIQRARLESAPARLTAGGQFSLGNVVTINVHGVTDPNAVANRVAVVLSKRGRHHTTQQRGTAPGTREGQR